VKGIKSIEEIFLEGAKKVLEASTFKHGGYLTF